MQAEEPNGPYTETYIHIALNTHMQYKVGYNIYTILNVDYADLRCANETNIGNLYLWQR